MVIEIVRSNIDIFVLLLVVACLFINDSVPCEYGVSEFTPTFCTYTALLFKYLFILRINIDPTGYPSPCTPLLIYPMSVRHRFLVLCKCLFFVSCGAQ